VWERDRGWYTTAPTTGFAGGAAEPERFVFPEGIGEIECVNVEHEEVVLIARWIDCRRVTFKYGPGDEFIDAGTWSGASVLGPEAFDAARSSTCWPTTARPMGWMSARRSAAVSGYGLAAGRLSVITCARRASARASAPRAPASARLVARVAR
jgi:hypothetical protein